MAEKYGTIPKKFTKECWSYFWGYYKVHTIVTIILVVAVASSIYSKVTAPKYDLTLGYVGNALIDEATEEKIKKEAGLLSTDVNKDGEVLCAA